MTQNNNQTLMPSIEVENPTDVSDLENLLLNLHGGLRPKHLTKEEVELLEEEYGEDWFEDMGYDDYESYEKPEFD